MSVVLFYLVNNTFNNVTNDFNIPKFVDLNVQFTAKIKANNSILIFYILIHKEGKKIFITFS